MSFRHLKVGDKVTRLLAGMPMNMEVEEIREDVIVCSALPERGGKVLGEWTFCRDTGAEEDEEIGWGKKFGVTGSYLVR